MIRVEKGELNISGNCMTLSVELTLILAVLKKQMPKVMYDFATSPAALKLTQDFIARNESGSDASPEDALKDILQRICKDMGL